MVIRMMDDSYVFGFMFALLLKTYILNFPYGEIGAFYNSLSATLVLCFTHRQRVLCHM